MQVLSRIYDITDRLTARQTSPLLVSLSPLLSQTLSACINSTWLHRGLGCCVLEKQQWRQLSASLQSRKHSHMDPGEQLPLWLYMMLQFHSQIFTFWCQWLIYFTFVSSTISAQHWWVYKTPKSTCSGETFNLITKWQGMLQRRLKQNILPSLQSLANKICYKKNVCYQHKWRIFY